MLKTESQLKNYLTMFCYPEKQKQTILMIKKQVDQQDIKREEQ